MYLPLLRERLGVSRRRNPEYETRFERVAAGMYNIRSCSGLELRIAKHPIDVETRDLVPVKE